MVLQRLPWHGPKPAVLDAMHAADGLTAAAPLLVETCSVRDDDLFQLVSLFPSRRMIIDPTYGDVRRTSEASIVEILFLTGPTVDQKSRLFHAIAERAVRAAFKGDDIMITLTENAANDWSLGFGRAFRE